MRLRIGHAAGTGSENSDIFEAKYYNYVGLLRDTVLGTHALT